MIAGSGKYATANSNYYLYKGSWYWTLTPFRLHSFGYSFEFIVYPNGMLTGIYAHEKGDVVPVLNLTSEYVSNMIGDGTIGNEYRIE